MTSLDDLQTHLKLLSDPTRLRLLALLAVEELAVHEMVSVTGLAQSRVSNHLSLLKRAGLVVDRREGSWSFHRLAETTADRGLSKELFEAAIRPFADSDRGRADRKALESVREQRRERSRTAHDALAERWVELGQEFAAGSVRAEAWSALVPDGLTVADLGCGAGFLTSFLAQHASRVIAVDHSNNMLDTARQRVDSDRVEFRRGELDALPLADGEADAAFVQLVWHHVADHDSAAREVARVVRPGGKVVVTDLLPHDEEWMRDAMGDLRLGIRPDAVTGALVRAGFQRLVVEPIVDRYVVSRPDGERVPLAMFKVCGVRPAAAASPAAPSSSSRSAGASPTDGATKP